MRSKRVWVFACLLLALVLGASSRADLPSNFAMPKAQLSEIDILLLDPSDPSAQRVQGHLRGARGETRPDGKIDVYGARFVAFNQPSGDSTSGEAQTKRGEPVMLLDAPHLTINLNTWRIQARAEANQRPVSFLISPGVDAMRAFDRSQPLLGNEAASATIETNKIDLWMKPLDGMPASEQGTDPAKLLEAGFILHLSGLEDVRLRALGNDLHARNMEISAHFPPAQKQKGLAGLAHAWPERMLIESPRGLDASVAARGLNWNAPIGEQESNEDVLRERYQLSCLGRAQIEYELIPADQSANEAPQSESKYQSPSLALSINVRGNVTLDRLSDKQSPIVKPGENSILRAELLEIEGRITPANSGDGQPENTLTLGDSQLHVDRVIATGDMRAFFAGASASGDSLEVLALDQARLAQASLEPGLAPDDSTLEDGPLQMERRFILTGRPLLRVDLPGADKPTRFADVEVPLLICDARRHITLSEARYESSTRYALRAAQLASCRISLGGIDNLAISGDDLDVRLRITPDDVALITRLRSRATGPGLAALNPRSMERVSAQGSPVTPRLEYFERLNLAELTARAGEDRVREGRVPRSLLYLRRLAIFGEELLTEANRSKLLTLRSTGVGVRLKLASPQSFFGVLIPGQKQSREELSGKAEYFLSTDDQLEVTTDLLLQAQLRALESNDDESLELPEDVIPGSTFFHFVTASGTTIEELPQAGLRTSIECGPCELHCQLERYDDDAGNPDLPSRPLNISQGSVGLSKATFQATPRPGESVRCAFGYDFLNTSELNLSWSAERQSLDCAGPVELVFRSPIAVEALSGSAEQPLMLATGSPPTPSSTGAQTDPLAADSVVLHTPSRMKIEATQREGVMETHFELSDSFELEGRLYVHAARLSGIDAQREWEIVTRFDYATAWKLRAQAMTFDALLHDQRVLESDATSWNAMNSTLACTGPVELTFPRLATRLQAGELYASRTQDALASQRAELKLSGPVTLDARSAATSWLLASMQESVRRSPKRDEGPGGTAQLLAIYPGGATLTTDGEIRMNLAQDTGRGNAQAIFAIPQHFILYGRRADPKDVHQVNAGSLVARFNFRPDAFQRAEGKQAEQRPWFDSVEELRADGGVVLDGNGIHVRGERLFFNQATHSFTLSGRELQLGYKDSVSVLGVNAIEFMPGDALPDAAIDSDKKASPPTLEVRGKKRTRIRINTEPKGVKEEAEAPKVKRKIEERGNDE